MAAEQQRHPQTGRFIPTGTAPVKMGGSKKVGSIAPTMPTTANAGQYLSGRPPREGTRG
jgi:hypothetical protein